MTTSPIPVRASLVGQTERLLEQGMAEGRWTAHLPSQRELCAQLAISRTTLRAALQHLAQRGLLAMSQGRATELRASQSVARPAPKLEQVVLLLPSPVWTLRPSVAQWITALRPLLNASGLELLLVEGGLHYRARADMHLPKLVASHPDSAWVLFGSTHAMQTWFAASGLPVVSIGGVFPGCELPSIEYDHAAIAQHAAHTFAAAGHERTAVLLQRTGSAADITTCDAFAAARRPGLPAPIVLEHDGTFAQIETKLRRLAGLPVRPTGLFVTKSHAIPATLTLLPRLGINIPEDISVICREDDSFLGYFAPSVARYGSDSAAIARKLAVALAQLASGLQLKVTHDRLMPRFISGHSLGRAPQPR